MSLNKGTDKFDKEGDEQLPDGYIIKKIREFRDETEKPESGEKKKKKKGTLYPIPKNMHIFDKMVKENKNILGNIQRERENLDFLDFDVSRIGEERSKLQTRKIGEEIDGAGGKTNCDQREESKDFWPENEDKMRIFDSFVTTTTDLYREEPIPSLETKNQFESLNSILTFAMARSFLYNTLTVLPLYIALGSLIEAGSSDMPLKNLKSVYFFRQLCIHFLIMLSSVGEFWHDFCKPRIKNFFTRNFEIFKRKIFGFVMMVLLVYINIQVLYYKRYPLVYLENEFYNFFVALTCYNMFNSFLFEDETRQIEGKKTNWIKLTLKIFMRNSLFFITNIFLSSILLTMSQMKLLMGQGISKETNEPIKTAIQILSTKDVIINVAYFFVNTYGITEVSRLSYIQIYKSKFSDFFIKHLNNFNKNQVILIDHAELVFQNLESQSLIIEALTVIDQSKINLIDINSLLIYNSENCKPSFFSLKKFEEIIFRKIFVNKIGFISDQFDLISKRHYREDKPTRWEFERRSKGLNEILIEFFKELFSYKNLLLFFCGYDSDTDDKSIRLLGLVVHDLDGFEFYLKNLKFMVLSHKLEHESAFLGIKDTLKVYDSCLKNLDFFLYKIVKKLDILDLRVKLFYSIYRVKRQIAKLQNMIKINLRFTSTTL